MADNPDDLEGIPYGKVVDFFISKKLTTICPSCSTDAKWQVTATDNKTGSPRQRALVVSNPDGEIYMNSADGVVTVTCNNCAYVRLHSIEMLEEIMNRESRESGSEDRDKPE